MGKRELLIIAAFAALGVVIYQLTAPPSADHPRRFSLSALMDAIHRNARGGRTLATTTHDGSIPAGPTLADVLVSNVADVTIIGETRGDIAYSLTIESGGSDPASAKAFADRVTLETHDTGSAISVRPAFVREARQTARLTLHVPAKVAVRVEGVQNGSRVAIATVAAAELDGVSGDVEVHDIAGGVTGTHRNGDLAIARAGTVRLTVTSSDLVASDIAGPVTLIARNGHARLENVHGPVDLDVANEEASIIRPTDAVRVGGNNGSVDLEQPRKPARIDVRRTSILLTLDGAVEVTALTTDAPIRLTIDGAPAIAIDATATDGGTIHADDFGLVADTTKDEVRLRHAFGRGSARVELLDERAEIVIEKRK